MAKGGTGPVVCGGDVGQAPHRQRWPPRVAQVARPPLEARRMMSNLMTLEQALRIADAGDLMRQSMDYVVACGVLAREVRSLHGEVAKVKGTDAATKWAVSWERTRPGYHNPCMEGVGCLSRAEAIALAEVHLRAGHDNVSLRRETAMDDS